MKGEIWEKWGATYGRNGLGGQNTCGVRLGALSRVPEHEREVWLVRARLHLAERLVEVSAADALGGAHEGRERFGRRGGDDQPVEARVRLALGVGERPLVACGGRGVGGGRGRIGTSDRWVVRGDGRVRVRKTEKKSFLPHVSLPHFVPSTSPL